MTYRRRDGPKTQTGIETAVARDVTVDVTVGRDGPKTQTGIETVKVGPYRDLIKSRRTENPDRD